MRRQHNNLLLPVTITVALVLLTTACQENGFDHYDPTPVVISEIEVTNEFDVGRLEVEVHIVDARSGYMIGCSGSGQGLRGVDSTDIRYYVDADFVTPEGYQLFLEDFEYRDVEIWVIEDDEANCPGPYIPHADDIIGISRPFHAEEFYYTLDMAFGNVIFLQLGI